MEELGWTGFATPTLLRMHYGVLGTGLIVGVLWGVAHFPMYYWGRDASSGALWLAILLAAQMLAWFPPYRVLMVWVYDRTESLLLAMLMHVSLVTTTITMIPPLAVEANLISSVACAAGLWVVVAAVGAVTRGHLTRQPPLRGRVA